MKKLKEVFNKFKREKVYKAHLYSDGTEVIENVIKNTLNFKKENWQCIFPKIELNYVCMTYLSSPVIDFSNGYEISLYDSNCYYVSEIGLPLGHIAIRNIHKNSAIDVTVTVRKLEK